MSDDSIFRDIAIAISAGPQAQVHPDPVYTNEERAAAAEHFQRYTAHRTERAEEAFRTIMAGGARPHLRDDWDMVTSESAPKNGLGRILGWIIGR